MQMKIINFAETVGLLGKSKITTLQNSVSIDLCIWLQNKWEGGTIILINCNKYKLRTKEKYEQVCHHLLKRLQATVEIDFENS